MLVLLFQDVRKPEPSVSAYVFVCNLVNVNYAQVVLAFTLSRELGGKQLMKGRPLHLKVQQSRCLDGAFTHRIKIPLYLGDTNASGRGRQTKQTKHTNKFLKSPTHEEMTVHQIRTTSLQVFST